MKSNFDFLQTEFPVLSTFGCQAEKYCFSDPNSCLMKLGMIGESIVNLMFTYDRIQLPYDNTAVTRIDTLQREGLLTRDLTDILHALRKARNKAVHENYDSESECKILLQMAYSLCEWFMQTYGDWNYQHHDFIMPELENKRVSVTQEEKAAEERQAEELTKQAEQKASTAEAISKSERQKQAGKMASQRPKSEAETRYIIDEQLRQVGWEADTENLRYSKGTRPAKGHNMAIAEWPTNSSVGQSGRVDYALFVDTKLIGVIEAKAIHKDIPSVIDYQGKEYPRNIRKEDSEYQIGEWGEYKVPFTFATNGRPYLKQLETKSGIWFLDLRSPANNPTALHGWISPMGMVELLEKNPQEGNSALKALPYDFLTDPNGLNLREYQLNAIKAAEQSVIEGKKNILLAMATGTGKTRTVLGMIYRFLKTNRFKRILFLVDRTSLGEQASDVFKEIKLEDLMTLDEIYNIKGLEDKNIDKDKKESPKDPLHSSFSPIFFFIYCLPKCSTSTPAAIFTAAYSAGNSRIPMGNPSNTFTALISLPSSPADQARQSADHPPVRQIEQHQLHQVQHAPDDQQPPQQVPLPLGEGQKPLHPVPLFPGRLLCLCLAALRLWPQQVVGGDVEDVRQGHHLVRLRHGLVPLPAADGLPAHLQPLRQLVLAHTGPLPEGLQLFSECHRHSPFFWMPSDYQIRRLHASNRLWNFRNLQLRPPST